MANIPLNETINIAVDTIFENNPNIKIFKFATSETHFSL